MSVFSFLTSGSEPDRDDASPPVSPDASWPETQGVSSLYEAEPDGSVSPGEAPGAEEPLGWISSQWSEAGSDQAPSAGETRGGALAGPRRQLADRAHGLSAEFRDPRPETFRQHRRYIAGHPLRPGGKWEGAVFVTAYGSATFPVKGAGKGMVWAGNALREAGMRIDWAGDRFARVGTVIFFAAAVIIVILVFA